LLRASTANAFISQARGRGRVAAQETADLGIVEARPQVVEIGLRVQPLAVETEVAAHRRVERRAGARRRPEVAETVVVEAGDRGAAGVGEADDRAHGVGQVVDRAVRPVAHQGHAAGVDVARQQVPGRIGDLVLDRN